MSLGQVSGRFFPQIARFIEFAEGTSRGKSILQSIILNRECAIAGRGNLKAELVDIFSGTENLGSAELNLAIEEAKVYFISLQLMELKSDDIKTLAQLNKKIVHTIEQLQFLKTCLQVSASTISVEDLQSKLKKLTHPELTQKYPKLLQEIVRHLEAVKIEKLDLLVGELIMADAYLNELSQKKSISFLEMDLIFNMQAKMEALLLLDSDSQILQSYQQQVLLSALKVANHSLKSLKPSKASFQAAQKGEAFYKATEALSTNFESLVLTKRTNNAVYFLGESVLKRSSPKASAEEKIFGELLSIATDDGAVSSFRLSSLLKKYNVTIEPDNGLTKEKLSSPSLRKLNNNILNNLSQEDRTAWEKECAFVYNQYQSLELRNREPILEVGKMKLHYLAPDNGLDDKFFDEFNRLKWNATLMNGQIILGISFNELRDLFLSEELMTYEIPSKVYDLLKDSKTKLLATVSKLLNCRWVLKPLEVLTEVDAKPFIDNLQTFDKQRGGNSDSFNRRMENLNSAEEFKICMAGEFQTLDLHGNNVASEEVDGETKIVFFDTEMGFAESNEVQVQTRKKRTSRERLLPFRSAFLETEWKYKQLNPEIVQKLLASRERDAKINRWIRRLDAPIYHHLSKELIDEIQTTVTAIIQADGYSLSKIKEEANSPLEFPLNELKKKFIDEITQDNYENFWKKIENQLAPIESNSSGLNNASRHIQLLERRRRLAGGFFPRLSYRQYTALIQRQQGRLEYLNAYMGLTRSELNGEELYNKLTSFLQLYTCPLNSIQCQIYFKELKRFKECGFINKTSLHPDLIQLRDEIFSLIKPNYSNLMRSMYPLLADAERINLWVYNKVADAGKEIGNFRKPIEEVIPKAFEHVLKYAENEKEKEFFTDFIRDFEKRVDLAENPSFFDHWS